MIGYIFFRIIIIIFKFIPFAIAYVISDFFAFIMRDVLQYRKKIIVENLKKSFPEKTDKERKKIMRKFYQHLTDLMVESIKSYTFPEKQIRKRYTYANKEVSDNFFEKGQKIIFSGAHYGNWEWGGVSTPIELKHDIIVLYKPLANKRIDNYVNKMRSVNSAKMLSIYSSEKDAIFSSDRNFILVMIGDQNPSNLRRAVWTKFLNQPTACLHGIEVYAKKYNFPVLYYSMEKKKRGYYHITFKIITENPKETSNGEITKKFMNEVEKDIKRQPEYWLWSHRRWKHKFDESKHKLID